MTRAVIYVRVSSERQDAEDCVSIQEQLLACQNYAAQKGYNVVGVFEENRKYLYKKRQVEPSGTSPERPLFKAMIEAGYQGAYDVIIAWKEDRLYRGVYAAVPFGRMLEDTKIKVELVQENFDQNMLYIKASIGAMEINNIRDRMGMGVIGRLKKGKAWDVHVRFGYMLDENSYLVADPERAPWLVKIFEWYAGGVLTKDIQYKLVSAGAPETNRKTGASQRKFEPWACSTIYHILCDETYYRGYAIATRKGEEFQLPCPALITRELFETVKKMRKENQSHAKGLVKSDFLVQGKVTCLHEGVWSCRSIRLDRYADGKLHVKPRPGGRYFCNHWNVYKRRVKDMPICPGSIGATKLDNYVWNAVSNLLARPEIVRQGLDAELSRLTFEETSVQDEIDRIQKDLTTLENERHWVITQARKGSIKESEMDYQLEHLREQDNALRLELSEKNSLAAYKKRTQDLCAFAQEFLGNIGKALDFLNQPVNMLDDTTKKRIFEEKREIVNQLVDKIILRVDCEPEIIFGFELPIEQSEFNQSKTTVW